MNQYIHRVPRTELQRKSTATYSFFALQHSLGYGLVQEKAQLACAPFFLLNSEEAQ
jgi:hypothetical protein